MPAARRSLASVLQAAPFRDALVLAALALALCVWFFAGFGLGDDASYSAMAQSPGYPPVSGTNVFASRPLLLWMIAGSLRLFGNKEWSYVLPTMVSAVIVVVATYSLAATLATPRAGWFAAAAVALSPLHLAFGSTLCNDIVGTAFLTLGAALIVISTRAAPRERAPMLVAFAGGGIAGLSAWVKLSFIALAAPAIVVVALAGWREETVRRSLVIAVAGFAASVFALLTFFWFVAGDPLAGFRVEWAFNQTYTLPDAATRSLSETLLFYPRLASGMPDWGPPEQSWSPLGIVFPLTGLATLDAIARRRRAIVSIAVCLALMAAWLEFWPLQWSPVYVPIHRLPRFLYPLLVPGALVIGISADDWLTRGSFRRPLVWSIALATAALGLWSAERAVAFHNDSMSDPRFAADHAIAWTGPIAADDELRPYLQFRLHDTNAVLFPLETAHHLPMGAMVIAGGSRRPELDPAIPKRSTPETIPAGWVQVASMPGAVTSWRLTRGAVFLIAAPPAPVAEMQNACPADASWELQDVVDIGDPSSENAHAYTIDRQTWEGSRVLSCGGRTMADNGRAFANSQTFRVTVGAADQDVCVVKRIDAGVARQISRWTVNGADGAEMRGPQESTPGCAEIGAILPAHAIRTTNLSLVEQFVDSALDVNGFRVEVYQRVPQ